MVTRLDVVGEQQLRNRRDVEAVPKPSSSRQLLSLHRAPSTCVVTHGELSILPKCLSLQLACISEGLSQSELTLHVLYRAECLSF